MTKEEFIGLVRSHDLTFMYSDDYQVRQRGYDELSRIRKEAKAFLPAWVKEVWDENVDRVLSEGYRRDFYWQGN